MWSKSIAVAALVASVNSAATFPSKIDEIEDLLFLQNGYRSKGFTEIVSTCDQEAYAGFNNAAGIIRTGFHDVAAHANGKDGLDASIGFELSGEYSDKNAGPSFYADMVYFAQFFNSKASMADLLALGVVSAVKACGGPDVALRAGRIDATSGAAEPQLPDPGESIEKLTGRFSLMGFSPQEMIQLVACGHTIGAVHKGVSGGLDPTSDESINDAGSKGQFQFDSTPASFDNAVAREFCSPEKNGLPFGDSIDQLVRDVGRDSDTKIFQADKPDDAQFGLTIQSMANSNDAFLAQCQGVLEKMINLVPSSVQLSDVIQPYDVKPSQVDLNVQPDGSIGVFAEIRVRDGAVNGGVSNIQLVYTGKDGQGEIQQVGATKSAQGKGESFTFYTFSGSVSSISKFSVSINGNIFDNNGQGFPVDDSAFIQTASSTTNNGQVDLVVAVRGIGQPSITVTEKQGLDNGKLKFNTLPTLKKTSHLLTPSLTKSCKTFSFFTVSFTVSDANTAKIDLSLNGQVVDSFRNVLFGSSAASFSCSDPTSSSTTVSSTTSSIASSSTTSEATTTSSGSSTSSVSSTSSGESSTSSGSSSSDVSSTTSADVTSSSTGATSTSSSEGSSTSGASSESSSSGSATGKATSTTKSSSTLTTTSSKAGSTTASGSKGSSSLTTQTSSGSSSASGTKTGTGSSASNSSSSSVSGAASTKSSTSGSSKPSSSTKEGNPWQQWTQAASSTTSKSGPKVTPEIIVPNKPNKGAFADAVAEIVDKLNKNPAKGVNAPGHEQNVPGIDLHVKVPKVKPTVTATTQVYTQTVVYVTWNSAPTPTGQGNGQGSGSGSSYGQPSGSGASWVAVSSWSGSQQSAAPASTWQTWVASNTLTPSSTSPVKSFTGSASSINAGGFLFTAVGVLAAAILL